MTAANQAGVHVSHAVLSINMQSPYRDNASRLLLALIGEVVSDRIGERRPRQFQFRAHFFDTALQTSETVIDTVEADFDAVQADFDAVEARIDSVETGVNTAEPSFDTVETSVETIKAGINTVETSVDISETTVETSETSVDISETGIDSVETGVDTSETGIDPQESRIHARGHLSLRVGYSGNRYRQVSNGLFDRYHVRHRRSAARVSPTQQPRAHDERKPPR